MADKASALKRAPDGGPIVHPGKRFKGVKRVQTLEVYRRGDPDKKVVNIRPEWYDEELHVKVGGAKKRRTHRARLNDVPQPAKLEREVLATMSVVELKKLPEWEQVTGRSRLTSKEAIVSALLATGDDE